MLARAPTVVIIGSIATSWQVGSDGIKTPTGTESRTMESEGQSRVKGLSPMKANRGPRTQ